MEFELGYRMLKKLQRCIQNPVDHLRLSFLQKKLTILCGYICSQKLHLKCLTGSVIRLSTFCIFKTTNFSEPSWMVVFLEFRTYRSPHYYLTNITVRWHFSSTVIIVHYDSSNIMSFLAVIPVT